MKQTSMSNIFSY